MASVSPRVVTVERVLRRHRGDRRLTPQIVTVTRRLVQASPVDLDEATIEVVLAELLGGAS